MNSSKLTLAPMIKRAMTEMGGCRSIREVKNWIEQNGGSRWLDVGTCMADLVVNGNKSSTYKAEQRFLERVGRGVYRLAL